MPFILTTLVEIRSIVNTQGMFSLLLNAPKIFKMNATFEKNYTKTPTKFMIYLFFHRQYQLPDWVQPEYLRARMSDNGTLTVEVPVPQVQPSKYERLINIQNH
jgi:HSP20 family molecular chaperone IbpA